MAEAHVVIFSHKYGSDVELFDKEPNHLQLEMLKVRFALENDLYITDDIDADELYVDYVYSKEVNKTSKISIDPRN